MKVVFLEQEWLTQPARALCVSWALCASPSHGPRGCSPAPARTRARRAWCCNMLLRYFLPFIQRALQRINQLSLSSQHTVILQTRNLSSSEIQTGGGFPHSVQIKGKREKNKIMPHIQCKGLFISKLCR